MNEYIAQHGCSNESCSNCAKNNDENIAVHDKKRNRFRCRTCGQTWSGHRGDFHYGLRIELIKIRRALDMLKAGIPIRTVARFVKVSPNTVMRWKKKSKNFTIHFTF